MIKRTPLTNRNSRERPHHEYWYDDGDASRHRSILEDSFWEDDASQSAFDDLSLSSSAIRDLSIEYSDSGPETPSNPLVEAIGKFILGKKVNTQRNQFESWNGSYDSGDDSYFDGATAVSGGMVSEFAPLSARTQEESYSAFDSTRNRSISHKPFSMVGVERKRNLGRSGSNARGYVPTNFAASQGQPRVTSSRRLPFPPARKDYLGDRDENEIPERICQAGAGRIDERKQSNKTMITPVSAMVLRALMSGNQELMTPEEIVRDLSAVEENEIVFDDDDDVSLNTGDNLWGNPKLWEKSSAAEAGFHKIKETAEPAEEGIEVTDADFDKAAPISSPRDKRRNILGALKSHCDTIRSRKNGSREKVLSAGISIVGEKSSVPIDHASVLCEHCKCAVTGNKNSCLDNAPRKLGIVHPKTPISRERNEKSVSFAASVHIIGESRSNLEIPEVDKRRSSTGSHQSLKNGEVSPPDDCVNAIEVVRQNSRTSRFSFWNDPSAFTDEKIFSSCAASTPASTLSRKKQTADTRVKRKSKARGCTPHSKYISSNVPEPFHVRRITNMNEKYSEYRTTLGDECSEMARGDKDHGTTSIQHQNQQDHELAQDGEHNVPQNEAVIHNSRKYASFDSPSKVPVTKPLHNAYEQDIFPADSLTVTKAASSIPYLEFYPCRENTFVNSTDGQTEQGNTITVQTMLGGCIREPCVTSRNSIRSDNNGALVKSPKKRLRTAKTGDPSEKTSSAPKMHRPKSPMKQLLNRFSKRACVIEEEETNPTSKKGVSPKLFKKCGTKRNSAANKMKNMKGACASIATRLHKIRGRLPEKDSSSVNTATKPLYSRTDSTDIRSTGSSTQKQQNRVPVLSGLRSKQADDLRKGNDTIYKSSPTSSTAVVSPKRRVKKPIDEKALKRAERISKIRQDYRRAHNLNRYAKLQTEPMTESYADYSKEKTSGIQTCGLQSEQSKKSTSATKLEEIMAECKAKRERQRIHRKRSRSAQGAGCSDTVVTGGTKWSTCSSASRLTTAEKKIAARMANDIKTLTKIEKKRKSMGVKSSGKKMKELEKSLKVLRNMEDKLALTSSTLVEI